MEFALNQEKAYSSVLKIEIVFFERVWIKIQVAALGKIKHLGGKYRGYLVLSIF